MSQTEKQTAARTTYQHETKTMTQIRKVAVATLRQYAIACDTKAFEAGSREACAYWRDKAATHRATALRILERQDKCNCARRGCEHDLAKEAVIIHDALNRRG